MFWIAHIIKKLINDFSKKDNVCLHPTLTLSTGHALEAGTCSIKWTRYLHHKNKYKLVRNFKMSRNDAYVDNLSKQKVSPALALSEKNLTTALENEYGEKERGAWMFLRTINYYVMQPLLTISTSNWKKQLFSLHL